ncbi:MAG: hypothetical protein IBX36_00035 [Dehalococcoidia bacterium]|nr:hypothetical protein [Dehalococcoidia bacterium]
MKYRNFLIIGRIIGVLAWIVGILTFLLFLLIGVTAAGAEDAETALGLPVMIVMGIISGFLSFLFLYAFSRIIYVLVDIEENTRAVRGALKKKGQIAHEAPFTNTHETA